MGKISVIIPVYNVERYIEASLCSALEQTYKNVEYIIIDDCGTDGSLNVVEKVKIQYPDKDIKIIKHIENKGVSVARNTGIEFSSGDYIYIMDSDDIISMDCLQSHVASIEESGADFTCSNIAVINGRSPFREIRSEMILNGDDIIKAFYTGDLSISSCNKLYRRSFICENKIKYEENITMCEDVLWSMKCSVLAHKVVMIPRYTYDYIIHQDSAVTTTNINRIEKHFDSIIYVMNCVIDIIEKKKSNDINEVAGRWLAVLRFKNSSRLCTLDIKKDRKKEIFYMMNTDVLKRYSRGIYSYLCKMPYSIFNVITYVPYLLFKGIRKMKYGR